MRLSELKPGEYAIVRDLLGKGPIHQRLLSMGILPGAVIRVVRTSPFGDPVEYEIRGFFISLRKNEASYVEVDKIIPLVSVPPGSRVRVVLVDGGVGFMRNMDSMGISPGQEITVLRGCCPMLVETARGKFSIGRGIAHRIFVR